MGVWEGPSPRIRGELEGQRQVREAVGTIPANTGRMLATRLRRLVSRDHPREYGENFARCACTRSVSGPSPRIRGECWDGSGAKGATSDHPREYGENELNDLPEYGPDGPSPRIRGEYLNRGYISPDGGTIPANTGRIFAARGKGGEVRDHPREYGENLHP